MNSAVIVKVEYKPNGENDFLTLDIIPHSGNIVEENKETIAGMVFSTKAGFKIAESKPVTDTLLNSLIGRRAIFKITDANGIIYTVGDSSYRARFQYTRRADGTPGSFNGYDCEVTREAPTGCVTE